MQNKAISLATCVRYVYNACVMRIKVASFVYCLICNIPVCLSLCLAASIIGATNIESGVLTIDFNSFNWLNFLWNFLLGFTIAMIVGTFVPLARIGRWFTALFHVKNDTYTGNMKYRLLATLIITCIYYLAITPALTLLNYLLGVYQTVGQALLGMLLNLPIMILVGFVSSLINDIAAYKVAHMIDAEF